MLPGRAGNASASRRRWRRGEGRRRRRWRGTRRGSCRWRTDRAGSRMGRCWTTGYGVRRGRRRSWAWSRRTGRTARTAARRTRRGAAAAVAGCATSGGTSRRWSRRLTACRWLGLLWVRHLRGGRVRPREAAQDIAGSLTPAGAHGEPGGVVVLLRGGSRHGVRTRRGTVQAKRASGPSVRSFQQRVRVRGNDRALRHGARSDAFARETGPTPGFGRLRFALRSFDMTLDRSGRRGCDPGQYGRIAGRYSRSPVGA